MARIIVIDDDLGICNAVKAILARRGHSVVLAARGDHGIAITEVFAFDAVIVDIFMPGMNGFETIKLLRRCAPEVKVIVVSGYEFRAGGGQPPDFLRMAADLGAACCLRKPFTAGELIEAVDSSLGVGRERKFG
jgi:DNA-binding response OmpR family regulator